MGALTELRPKATVPVSGDRSILEVDLEALASAGLAAEVVVVGGHGWDVLRRHIAALESPLPRRCVLNAHYATTGPAHSVLAALEARSDPDAPLVVANGDTVFDRRVFALLEDLGEGAALLGSDVAVAQPDDLSIALDAERHVLSAAKGPLSLVPARISAGLLALQGESVLRAFEAAVRAVVAEEARTGRPRPWHDTLRHLAAGGRPARFVPVPRTAWWEFDHADCIVRYQERELTALGAASAGSSVPVGPR